MVSFHLCFPKEGIIHANKNNANKIVVISEGFYPPHFTSVKLSRVLDALGALLILGAIALLLALHAHKASRPRPPVGPSAPAYDPLQAIEQVQSLPLYQQAQNLYRHHQPQKAARLLQRIPHLIALNSTQNAFLQDQIQLCLMPHSPSSQKTAPSLQQASLAQVDCGPRALLLVCRYLGLHPTLAQVRRLCALTPRGTTLLSLAQAAQKLGLQATGVQTGRKALPLLPMPAIAWVNGHHFIAVFSLSKDPKHLTATVQDPNVGHPQTLSQERLLSLSGGYLLLLRRLPAATPTKPALRCHLQVQPAA